MAVEAPSMAFGSDATAIRTLPSSSGWTTSADTNHKAEEKQSLIQVQMPISDPFKAKYPALILEAYDMKSPHVPNNVMTLVHNGAKREIADLFTVVLPAMKHYSASSSFMARMSSSELLGENLTSWWSTLLQLFFFTAEIDEDIMKLVVEPVCRMAHDHNDVKFGNELMRRSKTVVDRYGFNMEVVLRAAERALSEHESAPDEMRLEKAVEKMEAAGAFMLETMDLALEVVREGESVVDVEIAKLEHSVVNSLWRFAKDDPTVLVMTVVGWMPDEGGLRAWVRRFGGVRGRLFFDSWKRVHHEKRASVVEALRSTDDS